MAEESKPVDRAPDNYVMRLFERPIQVRSFIMTAILALLVLYTLYFARFVFIPVVLALIFNLLLGPLVTRLQRWYVPRWISALLILGSFGSLVIYGAYALMGPAQYWINHAPRHSPPSASRRPNCSSRFRT